MDAASAVAALEALDGADVAPFAARLAHLAHLASLARHSPKLSLEALPDALVARVLSFLPASHMARVVRLSAAFRAIHVPTAMAFRVAQLHLNEAYRYDNPIDLLLAETEAAAAVSAADTVHPSGRYGIDTVCRASVRVSESPPAAITGEYVFSLSLMNLLFPPRDDGFTGANYEAGAAFKHVFYTHSDVVPTFPLAEDACAMLRDPRDGMAKHISEEARLVFETAGSAALVCAYLSVTQASTGETVGLLQTSHFGTDDPEDVEITRLMLLHANSKHDEHTHGGFMVGVTEYYLRLDSIGLPEGALGDNEGEAEGGEGVVGEEGVAGESLVQTTAKLALTMWSEEHSPGPFGGECFGYQEYGQGDLNDKLLCLLRNIDFQEPRNTDFDA